MLLPPFVNSLVPLRWRGESNMDEDVMNQDTKDPEDVAPTFDPTKVADN